MCFHFSSLWSFFSWTCKKSDLGPHLVSGVCVFLFKKFRKNADMQERELFSGHVNKISLWASPTTPSMLSCVFRKKLFFNVFSFFLFKTIRLA
jgi:hypothetical protein